MKKQIILLSLMLLAVVACTPKQEVEEKSEIVFGERYVEVAEVLQKDVSSYLTFSGKIKADGSVSVSPSLSGNIMEMLVEAGDVVKQGELLARLESTQLDQAKIQYDNLKKNYERMVELKKSDSINQQSFDEVETAYLAAKSGYEFLKKNTEVRAPISGTVSHLYAAENEYFNMMMDPYLLRIMSQAELKVEFQVSDVDVAELKRGMKVIVAVDTYQGEEFEGTLSFVSPEADMMSGSYRCEANLKASNFQLRNMQFARIKVLTETSQNTLSLPPNAVIDNEYVFVAEDGKSRKAIVKLGLINQEEIEVLSGVNQGDLVIVKGNSGMKSGDKISFSDKSK